MKLLTLKRAIFALLAVFVLSTGLLPADAYATRTLYYRDGLTGGAATALDSQDGAALADGDFAWVMDGTDLYNYRLDATSGAAESSPDVISPDTNAGNKRWILQNVYSVTSGVVPPSGVELTGGIVGMVLSNSTDTDHDISISAGACMDSTGVYHMANASAVVKRLDAAWAAGTAAGGLLNGSISTGTLYNIYALRKDADATADFGFLADGDAIATYKPAGYTYYRWVGFVVTDGSANIRGFIMSDNQIIFDSPWYIVTDATGGAMRDISGSIPADRTKNILVGATRDNVVDGAYLIGMSSSSAIYSLNSHNSGSSWADIISENFNQPPVIARVPVNSYQIYVQVGDPGQNLNILLKEVEIIR